MFFIRFNNVKNSNQTVFRTISNIRNYFVSKFNDVRFIKDSNSLEMSSGKNIRHSDGYVEVEMLIIKKMYIKESDIKDKASIDRITDKIKNFCDNAEKIENYIYEPLLLRKRK